MRSWRGIRTCQGRGPERAALHALGRYATLDHAARLGVFRQRAHEAEEIDAEMVEEAPVLGRQHRLDQVVRQLVDRNGVLMDDAAMAD